jgi:hypothetical protein
MMLDLGDIIAIAVGFLGVIFVLWRNWRLM